MSAARAETADHEARGRADRARATADLAVQGLAKHERHCDERQRNTQERLQKIEKDLTDGFATQVASTSRVHTRIDRLLWACIAGFGMLILLLAGALIRFWNVNGVVGG